MVECVDLGSIGKRSYLTLDSCPQRDDTNGKQNRGLQVRRV